MLTSRPTHRGDFVHRATRDELQRYHDQGFFFREAVFSESELEPMREAAENAHR
jgi:hypothetical protein